MFAAPDALVIAFLSIFVIAGLLAVLVLIVVSLRKPATLPLLVATGLLVLVLAVVVVSPVNVPTILGLMIALIGIAVGTVGGDPITRRVLAIATDGRVLETSDGGIVPGTPSPADSATTTANQDAAPTVLRGGTTIGYLERLAAVIAILAGFPEAIAVVVALKGIGRFSELASADARERFIIGSMTSLLWACAVGALIRLAIW